MLKNPFSYFSDLRDQIAAIDRSQGVIEFSLDGTIRRANDIFLKAVGYSLHEVLGQHHRIFMDPAEANSPAYAAFWRNLAQGEFQQGQFRRIAKGGREIWIQATYTPIRDFTGRPVKVIKFATDVTLRHQIMQKAIEATRMILDDSRLSTLSSSLTRTAGQTAQQVLEAERASVEIDERVSAAARGSGQMLSAIQEISRSSTEAATVARDAVKAAETTDQLVRHLGESSRQVGTVVEMIQSIAQQTNLLALNATIEASRAGEAGRGFAVVADEVKQLARRAEEATRQIADQIKSIQIDTEQSVSGIGHISRVISQIDALTGTIAAAVEEQTVTTNEITSHVQGAAESSSRIAQGLAEVTGAAKETSSSAEGMRQLASGIASLAVELDTLMRMEK